MLAAWMYWNITEIADCNGAAARDYEGSVVEVKTGYFLGLVEPEVAEAIRLN